MNIASKILRNSDYRGCLDKLRHKIHCTKSEKKSEKKPATSLRKIKKDENSSANRTNQQAFDMIWIF